MMSWSTYDQPLDHAGGARVVQAEEDHAGRLITDESRQAPKVQIEGEDTPIFPEGLCEDRLVRRSLEALVSPVDGIMTLLAQPSHHAKVHTHVGEEAHEGYGTRTSSPVSQAAYSIACWMSSRSRSG